MARTKVPNVTENSEKTPSSSSTPVQPSSTTVSVKTEGTSSKTSATPSRRSTRIRTSSMKAIDGPGSQKDQPIMVDNDSEATISDKPSPLPKRKTAAPAPPPPKKPKISVKQSARKGKGEMTREESKLKKEGNIQPSAVYDKEKWDKRGIMSGRIYLLDELKNAGWDVSPLIEEQGWQNILSQDEVIYPDLVKEFYGCMNIGDGKSSFTTQVKGKTLIVSPVLLSIALEIPLTNVFIYGDNWYESLNTTKEEVLKEVMEDPKEELVASELKDQARILHNIVTHSLVPRAGSFEKVKDIDLLLIYSLIKRYIISLPHIIFHYMIDSVKTFRQSSSLPYAMFLTKFFRLRDVELDGEKCIRDTTTFWSKSAKQMRVKPFSPKIEVFTKPSKKESETKPTTTQETNPPSPKELVQPSVKPTAEASIEPSVEVTQKEPSPIPSPNNSPLLPSSPKDHTPPSSPKDLSPQSSPKQTSPHIPSPQQPSPKSPSPKPSPKQPSPEPTTENEPITNSPPPSIIPESNLEPQANQTVPDLLMDTEPAESWKEIFEKISNHDGEVNEDMEDVEMLYDQAQAEIAQEEGPCMTMVVYQPLVEQVTEPSATVFEENVTAAAISVPEPSEQVNEPPLSPKGPLVPYGFSQGEQESSDEEDAQAQGELDINLTPDMEDEEEPHEYQTTEGTEMNPEFENPEVLASLALTEMLHTPKPTPITTICAKEVQRSTGQFVK